MARIFYHTDKGSPGARPIYGVHPDGNVAVPENIIYIDVAETPDAIVWPGGSEQASAIDEVNGVLVADPNYSPPTVLDYEVFEARFTATEQEDLAKFVYATDNLNGEPVRPALIREYNRAVARGTIDLESPKTAAFMDALVSGGVLTQARRDEILTP